MPLPAGELVTQVAVCPEGMVVTGGGSFTPPIDPAVSVTSSDWGASGSVPDFWSVTMSNQSAIDTIFLVDAICTTPTSVKPAGLEGGRPRPPGDGEVGTGYGGRPLRNPAAASSSTGYGLGNLIAEAYLGDDRSTAGAVGTAAATVIERYLGTR